MRALRAVTGIVALLALSALIGLNDDMPLLFKAPLLALFTLGILGNAAILSGWRRFQ